MQLMRFVRGPWCPWHVELVTVGEDRPLMLGAGRWRWLFNMPFHGPRWRRHVSDSWKGWQQQRECLRDRQCDDA